MIIDSHHHLWDYSKEEYDWIDGSMASIARNFTVNDARETMKLSGVSGSIVVQARQSLEETRWLLDIAGRDDFIKGVVGWVDLEKPELVEMLGEFKQSDKLVGFRHVLQGEPDDNHILRPSFIRGLKEISGLGYRYDILIFERQLAGALKMMLQIPELPCVIDHIAKPEMVGAPSLQWTEVISAIANETNAMCKLSGMVTEADWKNWNYDTFAPFLDHLFMTFGEERLMFGSDWPVCLVAGKYAEIFGIIQEFVEKNCAESASKIFGENASKFYGVNQ